MHVKIKNKSKLSLVTMLRRRRRTVKAFLAEAGITSYSGLTKYCDMNGIDNISETEYKKYAQIVSDPSEGIIVLNIDNDLHEEPLDAAKQRKRKKKQSEID